MHRVQLKSLFGSPWKFKQHSQASIPISELFPQRRPVRRDDLSSSAACTTRAPCIRRPIHHSPGRKPASAEPGLWITYGLGSENRDLPAFVAFLSGTDPGEPSKAPGWSAGFLPARYQGTRIKNGTIPNLALPSDYTLEDRRKQLDLISAYNHLHQDENPLESELDARIRSYELAYRMQTAAPEIFDISNEPDHIRKLYGLDQTPTREFGTNCLLARRLVERGVRFDQLRLAFWDAHRRSLRQSPNAGPPMISPSPL
jgi:hypothetical protein